MSTTTPATDAQIRYLQGLTDPERLARLSNNEARYLISWLRGPPQNMSRAQQLYLSGLIAGLTRAQARETITFLRDLTSGALNPAAAEVQS